MSEYNPLDEANLAKSVQQALEACPPVRMPNLKPFVGAGIYAIYYDGEFGPYELLAAQNKVGAQVPIYTGKAVPSGSRKGLVVDLAAPNSERNLFERLKQHRTSIESAVNIEAADFSVKWLVTKRLWIPMGEGMMIALYSPLWNTLVEGFGVNPQGSGRAAGRLSAWDTLHPGRPRQGVPNARTAMQLQLAVEEELRQRYS